MSLYRIPWPWDYHDYGAIVVVADSPEAAVAKARAWHQATSAAVEAERLRVATEDEFNEEDHDEAYWWTQNQFAVAGDVPDKQPQWDKVELCPGGIYVGAGCNC